MSGGVLRGRERGGLVDPRVASGAPGHRRPLIRRFRVVVSLLFFLALVFWVVSPFSLVVVRVRNESSTSLGNLTLLIEGDVRNLKGLAPGEERRVLFLKRSKRDADLILWLAGGRVSCGYIGRPSTSIDVTLRSDAASQATCRNGLWLLGGV